MANPEESSPLLPNQSKPENGKETAKPIPATPAAAAATNQKQSPPPPPLPLTPKGAADAAAYGWTADGLPLAHGSEVGQPLRRLQWDSGICSCLGRNDEFCSSDLEVCLLGSVAPCVLYGSNAERLLPAPGTFVNHSMVYSGLYVIGNCLFGWNCLAPWFSYSTRTAIRRKFNLEGSCEALVRSCGCGGSILEDEVQREHCETTCDLATHMFCHVCALCQEGREIRRRLPHPAFSAQPVWAVIPPGEQTMSRGGA
ncbi:hypothetical protein NMG60_11005488 [Bertholletia excelsa]